MRFSRMRFFSRPWRFLRTDCSREYEQPRGSDSRRRNPPWRRRRKRTLSWKVFIIFESIGHRYIIRKYGETRSGPHESILVTTLEKEPETDRVSRARSSPRPLLDRFECADTAARQVKNIRSLARSLGRAWSFTSMATEKGPCRPHHCSDILHQAAKIQYSSIIAVMINWMNFIFIFRRSFYLSTPLGSS